MADRHSIQLVEELTRVLRDVRDAWHKGPTTWRDDQLLSRVQSIVSRATRYLEEPGETVEQCVGYDAMIARGREPR